MLRGKYIGRHKPLWHKTALLRENKANPKVIFAQFDDLSLPKEYTHNWRVYPVYCFIILRSVND